MNRMIRAAAVEARITNVVLWLGVAATTLGLSTQANACNIRGQFCGHPAWAANAFSGPRDRVPEAALETKRYEPTRPSKPEKAERIVRKVMPEKVVTKVVPLVKFADGFGRQFDPASKVWFDGKSQCWSGKEQFTFKNGDWSYGKKEWAQANGAWKVESGDAPELVSCESVASFAAKSAAFAAKTAAQNSKPEKGGNTDKGASQPAGTPGPAKIKTAEGDTAAIAQKPVAPAASAECKKYFPSIGQMLTVPCTE